MGRLARLGMAGLTCMMLGRGVAFAQTGSIAGVVKDTSGAVLPGVTVEAASPVLIEKVRTAVTDGQGVYNTTLVVNTGTVQEMTVTTSGLAAEARSSGVLTNIIPKEGGNTYRGSFFGNFSNASLQTNNLTQSLIDKNLKAVNSVKKLWDFNPVLGGMQRTYPPDIAAKSADQIAEELARDAAAQRLGAFGEIGQQSGVLTDEEKRVFQAVAKAQARSGLPIFTHNAYTGTRPTPNPVPHDAALRQLDVLEGAGAKPEHIAIGHVCCLDDPKAEVAQQLAKRGVFVGFDRVTIPIVPDAERVVMIMAMVEAGYADHVLVSSDFAVASSLKRNGGAGIGQASTVFGPMLLKAGMSEALLHRILVDNPRRFLAFVPK